MGMKLFALEETDLEGDVVEMETAPEVGEVADVEAEVQEETAELSSQEEAIEEGIEAADQLEEVQEVVADAAEGEGLTPHAAECLRIAVEAICARVGANPKAMYSLYATENFQSASSRKANTKIALEGVVEFLKDLWKKIKASLMKLWEKASAFFDKHFSSLGRVKKALESMKVKVSESSGKVKDKVYLEEAPSSLVDAFAGNKDISPSVVKKYIKTHKDSQFNNDKIIEIVEKANKEFHDFANSDAPDLNKDMDDKINTFFSGIQKPIISLGTATDPLIGGVYITYTFDIDKNEGDLTVDADREVIDNKESKLGINVVDKSELQEIIKSALELINGTIKFKEKHKKRQEAFNKTMLSIDKAINKVADKDDEKANERAGNLRKIVKVFYKFNAKTALIDTTMFGLNVKLAKAVLNYSSFMLKQYKSVV